MFCTTLEMIFLGYDSNFKAFRCYNCTLKKVVIRHNVRLTDSIQNSDHTEVYLNLLIQTNLTHC